MPWYSLHYFFQRVRVCCVALVDKGVYVHSMHDHFGMTIVV